MSPPPPTGPDPAGLLRHIHRGGGPFISPESDRNLAEATLAKPGGDPLAATRMDQAPVEGPGSSSQPGGCPASHRVSFRSAVASRGFQPGKPRHSSRL
jgi:hypothetical protein